MGSPSLHGVEICSWAWKATHVPEPDIGIAVLHPAFSPKAEKRAFHGDPSPGSRALPFFLSFLCLAFLCRFTRPDMAGLLWMLPGLSI